MAPHKCIYCGNIAEPLYSTGSTLVCPVCRYPVGEGCCEGKRQALEAEHARIVAEQRKTLEEKKP